MATKDRNYADIISVNSGVTGSCNHVSVKLPDEKNVEFLVDCGLFQEKGEEENEKLNFELPFNPESIDFILVTHNHVDHTGRLPFVIKKGFYKNIYATETTCKLLPLALHDCFSVLSGVSKRKGRKCLYRESDVERTLSYMKPCKFNETLEISENVKVTFFNNGHLIGAALILLQISYPSCEDINILFTGDYNNHNIFFDVEPLPQWVLDLPLTIIQESTYGYMESTEIKQCFKQNILKCINREGTVIVPVFSLGRSQEILYFLKCMQKEGELSTQIPIYLDGKLAIKYTNLHIKDGLDIKESMRDFLPENLTYANRVNRNEILENTSKKIVLTTSGMGSYGPAQRYIPEYIARENALIQFTGFTAENSLGSRLRNTKFNENVEVGGLLVKKKASVEYTTEYSAHAKADEMIEFLKQFNNLKFVLVNHGEPEVKELFASRIVDENISKKTGILGKDYFFRINPYGFVKTIPLKLK